MIEEEMKMREELERAEKAAMEDEGNIPTANIKKATHYRMDEKERKR